MTNLQVEYLEARNGFSERDWLGCAFEHLVHHCQCHSDGRLEARAMEENGAGVGRGVIGHAVRRVDCNVLQRRRSRDLVLRLQGCTPIDARRRRVGGRR